MASGVKSNDFTHQFSTKQLDSESGLYYYGYRYYSADTGRWLSRDPIKEAGGYNLYGAIDNDLVSGFDVLGLSSPTNTEAYKACKEAQKKTTEDRNNGVDREYCGLICCNKKSGKKERTAPHAGVTRKVDNKGTTTNSCSPFSKGDCKKLKGSDWITVATYHSHTYGERFSPGDYNTTRNRTDRAGRDIPNYLGTPKGKVCKLVVDAKTEVTTEYGTNEQYPGTGEVTDINEDGSEENPRPFPYE